MSTNYQTVIYHKPTGAILLVMPNLYISSRMHLARLVHRPKWDNLGFIYFAHALEVDLGKHFVRQLSSNFPPSLVTKNGVPIEFDLVMRERRSALAKGVRCLVEFEGGMGDQLMEAAAILTAMKKYPGSSFAICCAGQYVEIVRRVTGVPEVAEAYVGQSRKSYPLVISNHTNYISDPRGGSFGKASLYGAWLGLSKVSKVVNLKLSKADYASESTFLQSLNLDPQQINILIQFRSGSGHAKSWQAEKVVSLAELFINEFGARVFVVGRKNELAAGLPHIVDLTGRSTWWQTCLLESSMTLVVCIDSGVMHLARSLGVPYIGLWGGTNAQIILGEGEQDLDIRLPIDCFDLVCYDCQRKSNACMTKITPQMVLENARLLFHNTSSK